jgi:hypothetical protein
MHEISRWIWLVFDMISDFFSKFEVIFRPFTVETIPYYFIVMFFAGEQSNEPLVSIKFREFLD